MPISEHIAASQFSDGHKFLHAILSYFLRWILILSSHLRQVLPSNLLLSPYPPNTFKQISTIRDIRFFHLLLKGCLEKSAAILKIVINCGSPHSSCKLSVRFILNYSSWGCNLRLSSIFVGILIVRLCGCFNNFKFNVNQNWSSSSIYKFSL